MSDSYFCHDKPAFFVIEGISVVVIDRELSVPGINEHLERLIHTCPVVGRILIKRYYAAFLCEYGKIFEVAVDLVFSLSVYPARKYVGVSFPLGDPEFRACKVCTRIRLLRYRRNYELSAETVLIFCRISLFFIVRIIHRLAQCDTLRMRQIIYRIQIRDEPVS